jgi:hypothetical protein
MAIGKAASCLMAAGAVWAAQFPVAHQHLRNSCNGVMTVDDRSVSFAGPKQHTWTWRYHDIRELKLARRSIYILTYKDSHFPGMDEGYEFTGEIPAAELYSALKGRMDQRLVAAMDEAPAVPRWSLPVKRLRRAGGSQGTLIVGADSIVYSTKTKDESRTWRYSDIDTISSSGPFQLTITTFERAVSQYGDRKGFNFELQQPITEAAYNELWLQIEKMNGRIQ